MKTVLYFCDAVVPKGDGGTMQCPNSALLFLASRVQDNNTFMRAQTRHACNDPAHIGKLTIDLLFDDEANVAAAKDKDAGSEKQPRNWKPVRQIETWELDPSE